ncbi:Ribonuclease HI [Novipirellula aureliae]|uniref:Ribonuclease HI n=2 Tax=Novipirellula aureliae TaxID=2527966 RepID=A0A5C6E7X0_9BACT|nr:Ribonuclease HI [Novipirellula aureliae]
MLASAAVSQYLLVCEARCTSLEDGFWSFSLETAEGEPVFAASDNEAGDLNRLTLLAAVRGLESIEGPSSVTLLSNNRYLTRSLSDSLPRWRENHFVWEHFGRRIDVQHADLWRRVDRALKIHCVAACLVSSRIVSPMVSETPDSMSSSQAEKPSANFRIDAPHPAIAGPKRRRRRIDAEDLQSVSERDRGRSERRPPAEVRPNDRLRQWLLCGGSSSTAPSHRRPMTTSELLEMS